MNLEKKDLDMQLNKKPFVSIYMITYNQEAFIEQAIESVMIQETNFEYKLFVGEDFSSDNTREICKKLKEKYPDKIELFLNEKNLGANKNAKLIFKATFESGAKYIALLEGDDYWTDSLKLQKQVDFLEANPDYVLCFHPISILKTNGEIVDDFITIVPENHETIETLARLGNYVHTPSVLFRNVIKEFPFEFEQSPIGDYFLYMMVAKHGKLKYLKDKMAVYREGVGIWNIKSKYFKNLNTAYTHALLVSYNNSDNSVSSILLDRIIEFLKAYENQIDKESLLQLNTCVRVNQCIYNFFLNRNKIDLDRSQTIQMKTSSELIREVLLRIKKRLWNKYTL